MQRSPLHPTDEERWLWDDLRKRLGANCKSERKVNQNRDRNNAQRTRHRVCRATRTPKASIDQCQPGNSKWDDNNKDKAESERKLGFWTHASPSSGGRCARKTSTSPTISTAKPAYIKGPTIRPCRRTRAAITIAHPD